MAQDVPLTKRQLEYAIQTVESRLKPKVLFFDAPPLSAGSPVAGAC